MSDPLNLLTTPLAELEKALGFDPAFLCIYCEQPVGALSMGGSAVCPACDCGRHRDGRLWSYDDAQKFYANARRRIAPPLSPQSGEPV